MFWNNKHMTNEDIANSCEHLAAALGLDARMMGQDRDERNLLRACPVYAAVQQTVIERVIATEDEGVDTAIHFIEDDGLPYWNDQDWRQEQEVLDVLHATAKRVLGVEA